MLIYFITLLAASLLVLANNLRNEANRWAAYFLASASVGGLSHVLADREMVVSAAILQFLNYTFTPYAVLIFSMLYTMPKLAARSRTKRKLLLLLPVLVMIIPAVLNVDERLFFIMLLLLFAPYYLLSCGLLIRSVWKEQDRSQRRSRLITTAIIVPTLLSVLVFIYGAKALVPDFEFFNYVSIFIVYSLVIASLSAFIYGVLGVKLKFEPDSQESRMKAVSTGATMLNHSIKNEIGKIAISAENVKAALPAADKQTLEQMQIITNASRHMLGMVARMHSQLKDIMLREQELKLDQLMDQCLRQHQEQLKRKQVAVRTDYRDQAVIIGDPVHLLEAIGNTVMNALEAMPAAGGRLDIAIDVDKRGARLTIADNGAGIPESLLEHVFEPFVSGGKAGNNFGLGLSYVFNVMQKSGGKVELENRGGGGARVVFSWPRRKLVNSRNRRESHDAD
jgi:signal transduction histidine kinase